MATILIVDDEPSFREVVGDILTAAGHRVLSSSNAEDAIVALQREKPTVILTDQMMPNVDGLAFVKRLRSNADWADIHVIVVSAKAAPEDIDHALQVGANDYLVKPFSADELRAVLVRASGPTE